MPVFEINSNPNGGIHKYRVFGYSILDILATLLFVGLCLIFFKALTVFNLILFFCLSIIASVFIHKLFKVNTKLTRQVFG
jgi:hypothetical protein